MTGIKLVNENGKIVGKDPDTGETVPIELGETDVEQLGVEQVIELPEAKEGDEAPAPTAVAYDPEEDELLITEEV